jgi:hypothetical protein
MIDLTGRAAGFGRSSLDLSTGAADAFLTKLSPDGPGVLYSTYIGGSREENNIVGGVWDVDALGNAYVGGFTTSSDFPTIDALQPVLHPGLCGSRPMACEDGFLAKLSPEGSMLIRKAPKKFRKLAYDVQCSISNLEALIGLPIDLVTLEPMHCALENGTVGGGRGGRRPAEI